MEPVFSYEGQRSRSCWPLQFTFTLRSLAASFRYQRIPKTSGSKVTELVLGDWLLKHPMGKVREGVGSGGGIMPSVLYGLHAVL